MTTLIATLKNRRQRRLQARRSPAVGLALLFSGLASLGVALGIIGLALAVANLFRDLPSLDTLPALLDPPHGLLLQPTRLYDRSGQNVLLSLENPAAKGHAYLPLAPNPLNPPGGQDFLPAGLVSATLASVQPDFWTSPGFSLWNLSPAAHPTIAQRLVSDLLLWKEPLDMRRALRERLLAAQLTHQFGREKILEWYLNSTNYGSLAYGADAAARVYFGLPASRLNLAQSALLAAVAESPALTPLDAPQAALERQKQVVEAMYTKGFIGVEGVVEARRQPLIFQERQAPPPNPAPAFTVQVLRQLETLVPISHLERGGYQVITSLDYDLQLQAACAAATQLARLKDPQATLPAADGSPCLAARLLPTLASGSEPAQAGLTANVVMLDPGSGEVLAVVGEPTPGLDPTQPPGHPAGTLLTPFVYLVSFTRGSGPASLAWDVPAGPASTEIQNLDGKYHGPVRMRVAMANDYIAPVVRLLEQFSPPNVWRTAQQFGLASLEASSALTTSLSSQWVTPVEAAQAYSVLANRGIQAGQADIAQGCAPGSGLPGIVCPARQEGPAQPVQPVSILRLEDRRGGRLWSQPPAREKPVTSAQLAYLATDILSDEAARWPSLGHPNPLEIGRPAAAKLGRTAAGSDGWAAGYTPQRTAVVWLGYPPASPVPARVPLPAAAGLWHAVMQYASRQLPALGWTAPDGISTIKVCDPSGLLPTPVCPNTVNEVFLSANEPTQADTLYRRLPINQETGHLATVLTPPNLVEEHVFLMIPAEAKTWAEQAGLPTPPNVYDTAALASPKANVQITSPEQFAAVKGQVAIIGSAYGLDFKSYRVQVGQGLNPPAWTQVGEDQATRVENGELAVWDTRGLNGLYAVQLQVIYADQRVDKAFALVTVDNQPPEVEIVYPADGEQVSSPGNTLTLQARLSDNLEVHTVEFFVDNQRVALLSAPPYAALWTPTPGKHTLRVRAADRAGNSSEAETNFTVIP